MDRLWPSVFRRRAKVPVKQFDPLRRRWTAARTVGDDMSVDRLSLATYNVWFSEKHNEQRYRAIADLLSRDAPDIMTFQEVTHTSLTVFLDQPWVRESYRSAAMVGGSRGNYGMLLLSRLPVDRVTYTRLPTRLSRGYLTTQLTLNGEPLTVVSVHLESGKASAPLRARQLGRIFDAQRGTDNVAIMGDFNMRDSEAGIIRADYRDVWTELRPDEPGYTEDTTINLMRYDMKNKHRHVRFDRVLIKGDTWKPESIELIGREPLSSALPRVFPSDHFGLRCTLVRG
ncbi:MAG: endonuclease/exonuclease/phosphatase family protein [Mycobacterium sp.]